MKRPAVFLDRDGTLVQEVNHLSSVDDLRLFAFSGEAVRMLKDHGFLVIVVTNQSGIGRGIFDESAMHKIHARLQEEFSDAIDGFYFCPHLPDTGCKCRKPGTGMIDAACGDLEVEMERSWMIGDKDIDILAGANADLSTILVSTGYGLFHASSLEVSPDYFEADLLSAARRVVNSTPSLH